jgi:putative cell wall-binding protein
MKRFLARLVLICIAVVSPPAIADHLEGVLLLAKDDIAAVARLQDAQSRHALLYFGDQLN